MNNNGKCKKCKYREGTFCRFHKTWLDLIPSCPITIKIQKRLI